MLMKNNRAFCTILILAAILAAIACAVNPVSGKKELMFFSEKAEIALGQDTDRQIKQQFGIYEDKGLNEYVGAVGRKMVPFSHRPNLQYHFAVLDTPVINAFAAPGGFIYVTRGIMVLMNSEAELAAVLGHELGHVAARHSVKRLSGTILLSVGLLLGSALNKDIAKLAGLAGIGMQLLFLKFSRSDEYQADSLGISYARQAAYSPGEMLRFFKALENMSVDSGGSRLPSFLSTHPLTKDRIAKVKEMVSSQDVRLAVKKEPYLRQVDGMVYGDNPHQGFAENGVFYHPAMAFFFTIPAGWSVENTPKQVVAGEKNGKAALILQAEETSQDLDPYLQAKIKEFGQAELLQAGSNAVNRFPCRQAYCRVPQKQGEPLAIRLACIRKDGRIYTFVGLSSFADSDIYQPVLERAIRSFQKLSDPRYLNRGPKRISLLQPNGRQTLETLMNSSGVERQLWKQLAVFNSIGLSAVPESGQLIKLVR
jgi:predicted Zn-dependent protease